MTDDLRPDAVVRIDRPDGRTVTVSVQTVRRLDNGRVRLWCYLEGELSSLLVAPQEGGGWLVIEEPPLPPPPERPADLERGLSLAAATVAGHHQRGSLTVQFDLPARCVVYLAARQDPRTRAR